MRFLHIADVHLGHQQYNVAERFNDFGRAFLDAVKLAVDEQVRVVVIAGDLFHRAAVDPLTLLQAQEGLQRLQAAGIAVLAVHGNHDRVRYGAAMSWLEYLMEQGLFCLLAPDVSSSPLALRPWDEKAGAGGYIDIDGVRFIGMPWMGASAPGLLGEIAGIWDSLDWKGIRFAVLLTHAGVEGQMPHMPGGIMFADLGPLRGKVDYLALGHLHKPYAVEGWIYNPGSLETCSFDEADYECGAYLVDVHDDGSFVAEHRKMIRRPFFTLEFKTDLFMTPAAFLEGLLGYLRQSQREIVRKLRNFPDPERALPVVRLILRGHLAFDRAALDMKAIREMLHEEIDALVRRVEDRTTSLGLDVAASEEMTRADLGRLVFESLIQSDSRYSPYTSALGSLMQQIKTLALEDAAPKEIYALLDEEMSRLEEESHVDHQTATDEH